MGYQVIYRSRTGGFVHGSDDVLRQPFAPQVQIAIEEATVILFMTDVTTGITDLDAEIADKLRRVKPWSALSIR